MAKTVRTKNDQQQEIVKLLNAMTGKFSLWQIWQDFITLIAISIANRFPGPYWQKREDEYLNTIKKYSKTEQQTFANMLALLVDGLDRNPDQDFLGELFMALELGSNWTGQFFTPYDVCQMMARVAGLERVKNDCAERGWAGVNDPACGAGATLIAFANECHAAGINYQEKVLFTGQDLDRLAGRMCYIQLSLLGCPGYVVIADTLVHPAISYDKKALLPVAGQDVWYTPMYYADIWLGRQMAAKLDLLVRAPVKEPASVGLLFF